MKGSLLPPACRMGLVKAVASNSHKAGGKKSPHQAEGRGGLMRFPPPPLVPFMHFLLSGLFLLLMKGKRPVNGQDQDQEL